MSITCAEVVPSTSAEKDSTLSRSPLTMAARCRATPIPARYDCHIGNGAGYRGYSSTAYTENVTFDGSDNVTSLVPHACLGWSLPPLTGRNLRLPETSPWLLDAVPSNACRNPDNDTQPWCYTTSPGVRWGYCYIPVSNPHPNPARDPYRRPVVAQVHPMKLSLRPRMVHRRARGRSGSFTLTPFPQGRHLESRPKAEARLDLEVPAGRGSPSSRGLWGGEALLLSARRWKPKP
jgi:hypothetical protein